MSRLDQILSPRHLAFWALLASVATVIALLITLGTSLGGGSTGASPSAPSSTSGSRISSGSPVGSPSLVQDSSPTPSPAQDSPITPNSTSESSTDVVTYLDDYVKECRLAVTIGPITMNGTEYVHGIHQWASSGGSSDYFNLSRKALRFQATVGNSDKASDKVRAKFELHGDNGRQLFVSRTLNFGETEQVDISVKGTLRITLLVNGLSPVWGYAGWADARITSPSKLPC